MHSHTDKSISSSNKAVFHLPGLFEFYDFYSIFLPVFYENRTFFYDHVSIGSIYGAPAGSLWGGGRTENSGGAIRKVLALTGEYGISARLTFSNSLLRKEHLADKKCNDLCRAFENSGSVRNGVIVHSDLLAEYIRINYPGLYLVSSTTKVITDFHEFIKETDRKDFDYVVPDFRLNNQIDMLRTLSQKEKDKVEFLVNECCYTGCKDRKACYENVSRRSLGENVPEHICKAPGSEKGYLFSKAMKSPAFIGTDAIKDTYLPMGFSNFKIEGRSLGSALILEFLLYYLARPEHQLQIREMIYLDNELDLF
jgi:hypothetical protein